jgi:hypothetical protein
MTSEGLSCEFVHCIGHHNRHSLAATHPEISLLRLDANSPITPVRNVAGWYLIGLSLVADFVMMPMVRATLRLSTHLAKPVDASELIVAVATLAGRTGSTWQQVLRRTSWQTAAFKAYASNQLLASS